MPTPALQSLAKQAGIPYEKAEEYWEDAKLLAEEKLMVEEEDFGDDQWAYTMGIVKNMMGISEESDFSYLNKYL